MTHAMPPGTETSCHVCGAPTPDTNLCQTHHDQLSTNLARIPELLHELNTAITKQARVNTAASLATKPPPISRIGQATLAEARTILAAGSPYAAQPAAIRDRIHQEIAAAVKTVTNGRAAYSSHANTLDLAAWLYGNTRTIALHPNAGDIHHNITTACQAGWRAVDTAPTRHYTGDCPNCSQPLHVPAEAHKARCRGCGETWDADELRQTVRRMLEDEELTVGGLLDLCRYAGIDITRRRIRTLTDTGRLVPSKIDADGWRRYRVGDLLNQLNTERKETTA